MNDQVEEGKAKAAGIVGIVIGVIAFIELICGFIYLSKGGPEGSGLWSGVGVNNCCFALIRFSLFTVRSMNWFSEIHLNKGPIICVR